MWNDDEELEKIKILEIIRSRHSDIQKIKELSEMIGYLKCGYLDRHLYINPTRGKFNIHWCMKDTIDEIIRLWRKNHVESKKPVKKLVEK